MLKSLKSYVHLFLLKIFVFFKEGKRWRSHNIKKIGCSVYYGYDHIPSPSEPASGGIIKCQDLQRTFPNTLGGANILYLVSSALPLYPQYLIRYAKKIGVKLVWNQNGVAYPAWHGPGWEKTNSLIAECLHRADYVIYQSAFCKFSSDKYLGKFKGQATLLHNPVDTDIFSPAKRKIEGFKILIAGTHNEKYRIQSALCTFEKVLKKNPDVELIVAGPLRWRQSESDAKLELSAMCKEIGIDERVKVTGGYSQLDAVSLLQSVHMLLHTQFNDACPRLVVEAMACGLPVVYSASGGTVELVGDIGGVGVQAPLDWESIHIPDPQLMADAVCQIHKNYQVYSENARKRAVERFDVQPWLKRHEQIFQKVLA